MTNIDKFNRRLGEALGCNPHGEPLYKWFDTNKWEHWMRKLDTSRLAQTPGGIYLMEPVYTKRLMCPALPDRWIIGHWHEPEPEHIWRQIHGADQLWPARGYYVQTNFWCPEIGQEPTYSDNERFIMLARRHRSMTAQEDTNMHQEAMDKEEKAADAAVDAFLDDLLPTFSHVPGIRGGNVSYPSTAKDRRIAIA